MVAACPEAQAAPALARDRPAGPVHPELGRHGLIDWHARYVQQARWTRDLREYLLGGAGLRSARRVLEVGCGTGAVLLDLARAGARIHGLDNDSNSLRVCRANAPFASLTRGDALELPFVAGTFDIAFCHYLLLWVSTPIAALREMKRVTRRGGSVMAFAEPDYSGRLDRPRKLEVLGRLQTDSLRRQGANPAMGGQLRRAFEEAGLMVVEAGRIKGAGMVWTQDERESEWAILESDLQKGAGTAELARLKQVDEAAWTSGTRVLDIPTYYAWGHA